jgi:hypothetical protein
LTKKAENTNLGWDTLLLAGVISSFFYVLPLGRYSVAGIGTDFRAYDFSIAMIALLVGLRKLPEMKKLWTNHSQYHYWALLLLIITLFSMILTIILGGGNVFLASLIRYYRFFAYFIIIPGLIVTVVDTPKRQRFLFIVFYANIAIQACLAFAQGMGWISTFWPAYWTGGSYGILPVGTLSPHHLQIAIIMMIGIPLSDTLLRLTSYRIFKLLVLLLIPIMAGVIIFSGTRSIWVSIIPMILAYIYIYKFNGFVGLIIFALLFAGFMWGQDRLVQEKLMQVVDSRLLVYLENESSLNSISSGRVTLYTVNLLDVWQNVPWVFLIGVGFQNIASVFGGATGAHNNYFQAWIELGLFGLIVYLRFLKAIWDTLHDVYKNALSSFEKDLAKAALISFVGILTVMLANEVLWAQYSSFTLSGQILIMIALASSSLNWSTQKIHAHLHDSDLSLKVGKHP